MPSRCHSRAKMPSTLRWRCKSHAVEPAQELRAIAPTSMPAARRCFAVAVEPGEQALSRPDDVAVLEQRHEVVADGTAHRVLEIHDAGIALRAHEEVARMVVAMHEHDRLRERLVAEPVEGRRDHGALAVVRREREVARQEPFREELELAHQEFAVVGRQLRRGSGIARLHAHERVDRVRVERLGIGAVAERLEVMLAAEVADQHESLLGVHRDHRRHVHAGRREDARRRAATHRGSRARAARPSRSAWRRRDARGNSGGSSRRRTRARCARRAGPEGPRSIVRVCAAADRRCRSLSCRGDGRGARIIDFPTPVISRRLHRLARNDRRAAAGRRERMHLAGRAGGAGRGRTCCRAGRRAGQGPGRAAGQGARAAAPR